MRSCTAQAKGGAALLCMAYAYLWIHSQCMWPLKAGVLVQTHHKPLCFAEDVILPYTHACLGIGDLPQSKVGPSNEAGPHIEVGPHALPLFQRCLGPENKADCRHAHAPDSTQPHQRPCVLLPRMGRRPVEPRSYPQHSWLSFTRDRAGGLLVGVLRARCHVCKYICTVHILRMWSGSVNINSGVASVAAMQIDGWSFVQISCAGSCTVVCLSSGSHPPRMHGWHYLRCAWHVKDMI